MTERNIYRYSKSRNPHFRCTRERAIIKRIKEKIREGKSYNRLKVARVRQLLLDDKCLVSSREVGHVLKIAFPALKRRRIHSCWYYYGIQEIESNCPSSSVSMVAMNQQENQGQIQKQVNKCNTVDEPKEKKEKSSGSYKIASSVSMVAMNQQENQGQIQKQVNKCNTVDEPKEKKEKSSGSYKIASSVSMVAMNQQENQGQIQKQVNKCNTVDEPKEKKEKSSGSYKIASLNICYEDLVYSDSNVIGSGTFGKCFSGKYKGLPVAVKVFKGQQHCSIVHKEAGMLTKIPSHPNIAMLIGVYTFGNPFLLVTKLCTIEGNPKTYAVFLKEHEMNNTLTTNLCIPIIHEMSSAISHVHKQGILHNDIKGNNFVIEEMEMRKRPVLIDFGKATIVSRTKGSQNKKSMNHNEREIYRKRFPHIAPEVSLGSTPSIMSDTYSFGFLFCSTMRILDSLKKLEPHRYNLLKIGQSITHYDPKKRSCLDKVNWNNIDASNVQ